jgi:hypothetical protein
MCRAAVANNDVGRIRALLPRFFAAQLQPCRAQRIQVGILGYSGEAVNTCGLVGHGERAVIDQPLQILPRPARECSTSAPEPASSPPHWSRWGPKSSRWSTHMIV